jgi:hypothetical protein
MGSAVAALMWDAVEPESVALDGVEPEGVELIGVPVLRLESVTPSSSRRYAAAVTPYASTGYRHWLAPSASDSRESGFVLVPSRPGEFHPEPLTDPDWNLSIHPARAIARRLPPSAERRAHPGEPVGPNQQR